MATPWKANMSENLYLGKPAQEGGSCLLRTRPAPAPPSLARALGEEQDTLLVPLADAWPGNRYTARLDNGVCFATPFLLKVYD